MSGGVAAVSPDPNPLEGPSQAVRPGDRHNCEDGAHRKVLSQRGAQPEEREDRDLRRNRDAESGHHIGDLLDEGHRTRRRHYRFLFEHDFLRDQNKGICLISSRRMTPLISQVSG
jgi:hypothetical protein